MFWLFMGLIFIFIMTMTGVILALFFRRDILDNTVVLSFALGVMLASGIFSLLIPSITMLKTNNTGFYPLYIGVAIGIAIIVIVGVWFIFAKVLKNKKPKEVTLKDIIAEIKKPGRDPREEGIKPILRTDVLKIEDITEGMIKSAQSLYMI